MLTIEFVEKTVVIESNVPGLACVGGWLCCGPTAGSGFSRSQFLEVAVVSVWPPVESPCGPEKTVPRPGTIR
jgi:hypothetical protein